jgi:hypothetical protein
MTKKREIARALDAAVSAGLDKDTAEHIVRMREMGMDPGIGFVIIGKLAGALGVEPAEFLRLPARKKARGR